MQMQRTADPERRSHLLKKVTTSRTGFSIRFSPVAHSSERMIAKSGFHDSLALETCFSLFKKTDSYRTITKYSIGLEQSARQMF